MYPLISLTAPPNLSASEEETLRQWEEFAVTFDANILSTILMIIAGVVVAFIILKPYIKKWLSGSSFDINDYPLRSADIGDYFGMIYEPSQTEENVRCAVICDAHGNQVSIITEDDNQTILGFTCEKGQLFLHITERDTMGNMLRDKWVFNTQREDFDAVE